MSCFYVYNYLVLILLIVNSFFSLIFNKKLIFLNFLFLGYLNFKLTDSLQNSFSKKIDTIHQIHGKIYDITRYNDHQKIIIITEFIKSITNYKKQNFIKKNIKILLKTSLNQTFERGDKVSVKGTFQNINNIINERYCKYLKNNNINYFINSKQIQKKKYKKRIVDFFNIYFISQNLKDNLLLFLKHKFNDPLNFKIISSLVFGTKNLDKEIKDKFMGLGIMHVFAISGLHLGILIYLMSFFFNKIYLFRIHKNLKYIILCLVCWAFAFFSNLSDSILRASIMISIIFYYKLKGNHLNLYAVFCTTLFIILLIYPLKIFSLGLQLSCLSLLGILFFYPYFKSYFSCKNYFLKFFVNSSLISISAQILSLPLLIYHFNIFPILSIFANWIAVPMASILIFLVIMFFITYWLNFLNQIVIFLINLVINCACSFFNFLYKLPFCFLYVKLSLYIVVYLYLMITLFALFLKYRNYNLLYLFNLSIVLFFLKDLIFIIFL